VQCGSSGGRSCGFPSNFKARRVGKNWPLEPVRSGDLCC
jgi:hypothetical protein